MRHLLLSALLLSSTAACSTLTTGTSQNFAVETPYADGASCQLKDTNEGQWMINQTPGSVKVSKGDGPMTITCNRPGFKTTTKQVEETFAGATLGNILIGGGIGIVVDATSGAAQEYPELVKVWMEPTSWPSPQIKANWEAKKAEWEAQLKKEDQEPRDDAANHRPGNKRRHR